MRRRTIERRERFRSFKNRQEYDAHIKTVIAELKALVAANAKRPAPSLR